MKSKYLSRKFLLVIASGIALIVLRILNYITPANFITGLVSITGMYITGNVATKFDIFKNGGGNNDNS